MSKRKREEKSVKGNLKSRTAEPSSKQQKLNDGARSRVTTSKNKTGNGKLIKTKDAEAKKGSTQDKMVKESQTASFATAASTTIQIITGSYERSLHGIIAEISLSPLPLAVFSDSFLFNAHSSAIRSLALSPSPKDSNLDPSDPSTQSVYLATGGSDERINIYTLSRRPVPETDSEGRQIPSFPSLGASTTSINENPLNRELGTLVQHSATITALHFPSRSKLLAASEDNTISITRLRDLEVVSTIKAPRPKISGHSSGDTNSAATAALTGINDFAIHPSQKLMLTVGRSERSMRLWNLVTGKKAGVLNFERSMLQAVHESKYSHGEGRKIRWNPDGTEFAVAFEHGVVVFGGESVRVKCIAVPEPRTKIHQIAYVDLNADSNAESGDTKDLLAISTESGKVLLFNTSLLLDTQSSPSPGTVRPQLYPTAALQAEIDVPVLNPDSSTGGSISSSSNRIKDFKFLDLSNPTHHGPNSNLQTGQAEQNKLDKYGYECGHDGYCLVTAHSNGTINLFSLTRAELQSSGTSSSSTTPTHIGLLIASYTTATRITCLEAFIMSPASTLDVDGGLSASESELEFDGDSESENDFDSGDESG